MENKKPQELIDLLNLLYLEKDKTKYQLIYAKIADEVMSLTFEREVERPMISLVYKKLTGNVVSDFIYSGQSEESKTTLLWLIDTLETTRAFKSF